MAAAADPVVPPIGMASSPVLPDSPLASAPVPPPSAVDYARKINDLEQNVLGLRDVVANQFPPRQLNLVLDKVKTIEEGAQRIRQSLTTILPLTLFLFAVVMLMILTAAWLVYKFQAWKNDMVRHIKRDILQEFSLVEVRSDERVAAPAPSAAVAPAPPAAPAPAVETAPVPAPAVHPASSTFLRRFAEEQ